MWRLSGEHLEERARERVDITARRDLLLGRRLFGGHVVRRAQRQAGFRHASAGGGTYRQCDAEVGDHRAPIGEEDILRLDVTMHDTTRMRIAQGIRDVARNLHGFIDTELCFTIELRAQRLAATLRLCLRSSAR